MNMMSLLTFCQFLSSSKVQISIDCRCKKKDSSVEHQATCFSVDLHPDFNLRPFDCRKLVGAGTISVTDSFFTSIYILVQDGRKDISSHDPAGESKFLARTLNIKYGGFLIPCPYIIINPTL